MTNALDHNRPQGYADFLALKAQSGAESGFRPLSVPTFLFDFQSYLLDHSVRMGRSAMLIDCGMGKSPISICWADNVARHTNKPTLILTPLAVAKQFVAEGEKFGIEVTRSHQGEIPFGKKIIVANYERLHKFSPDDFSGVVCDEASCIKAFDGSRRTQVTEFLRTIPYRLMATATAAPNDYIELGTLSEALGVMGQTDMLNRFFRNDRNTSSQKGVTMRGTGAVKHAMPQWRFKGHAELPFWRWVCGYARAARKPSDLGNFSDDRFKLPPLIEREHIVETRTMADGMLFALPAANRQEELEERRRTIAERCEMAAELTAYTKQPYIIWCQLNQEGDLLEKLCRDAVQISGADSDETKEEKYSAFLSGQSRGMVSKQKIGGWGLNCQHCAHVVEFASHSFEAHYQGVRRCWRYGQTRPVTNDIIATEGGRGAKENMRRKSDAADKMFSNLVRHMNEAIRIESGYKFTKETEVPSWL